MFRFGSEWLTATFDANQQVTYGIIKKRHTLFRGNVFPMLRTLLKFVPLTQANGK
jgi:hypothetical protein